MDFTGKTCPVCSKTFVEDDDIVVCPRCGAPYHRDCYNEKGKCIFPELHKEHKTWHEVYDADYDGSEEESDNHNDTVKCPVCGTENPKNAIVCNRCGEFLSKNVSFHSAAQNTQNQTNYSNPQGFDANGTNPFIAFLDPMGGVKPDEDFDGVTGAELSKYVKNNTAYYLPVFKRIRDKIGSRFNFMAFLFTGGWYLFRKMYVKGAVLAILSLGLVLASDVMMIFFARDLWIQATEALTGGGNLAARYITYQDYFNWIFQNCEIQQILLMFLPAILNLFSWVIMIYCGITANKSYYKHSVSTVRKLKDKAAGEDASNFIAEKGGVNMPIAITFFVCYMIISFATLFI